jgi:hypothetical protein
VSSAPAPQFDPIESTDRAESVIETEAVAAVGTEQPQPEPQDPEPAGEVEPAEYIGVIHLTRTWVQYGIFGFAVLCIVIGAVEALLGK